MTLSSAWWRVARGASQVAQHWTRQRALEGEKVAVRVAQHGVDLTQKATDSWGSSLNHLETVMMAMQQTMQQQQQQQHQQHTRHSKFDSARSFAHSASAEYDSSSQSNVDVDQVASDFGESTVSQDFSQTNGLQDPLMNAQGDSTREDTSKSANDNKHATRYIPDMQHEKAKAEATSTSLAELNKQQQPEQQQEQQQHLNQYHAEEGVAVPATRFSRAMGFARLGASLVWGTARQSASRLVGSGGNGDSLFVHSENADQVAATLCRMRGAALKLGQMLSIQDASLLPPALHRALAQVRQGSTAMPTHQLHEQLSSQLGSNWRDLFQEFDEWPRASASIGQVHRATTRDGRAVVVKVQFPGVAQSITSDLQNLGMLVKWSNMAPKGLFLDNIIRVGQTELSVECDYERELKNQQRIKQLVEQDEFLVRGNFVVPDVVPELSTSQVLTTEFVSGGTIDKVSDLSSEERNRIGRAILYLTMQELFVWRFMQTDPNWGNFLYDTGTRRTALIDFGATRDYTKEFVDGYIRIVWAAANRDKDTLMEQSHRMGFLTGQENDEMKRAHLLSGFTVGEPFQRNGPFDFKASRISSRMGEHTAVFLKHRLTAPPTEVYTLHRKLAGAYMLCIQLGAVVSSRDLLENIVRSHVFGDGLAHPMEA